MKKTIAALAVVGAFAGSAMAADVTLYGVIDTGMVYQNSSSYDVFNQGVDSEDTFSMKSGFTAGSRFGIKGAEDLGNGLTVGFVLENGFDSDTGELGYNDRLFGREAQAFIRGTFGELSMGRVGSLNSGNGTYGLTGNLSPFGTTWGEYSAAVNNVMSGFDRYDNTLTYKSPDFAGVNVYLQYSMDQDSTKDYAGKHGVENKSSADRYYAVGVTYNNGPLNLVGVVDVTNYSALTRNATPDWRGNDDVDDGVTVTLGGSYDFEVTKVYLGAQYFDQVDLDSIDRVSNDMFAVTAGDRFTVKGYGLSLGADMPVGNGVFKVGTAFMKGTIETVNGWDMADGSPVGEIDLTRWNTSVGYQHNLSKRTSLYGVASYSYNKAEGDNAVQGLGSLDADPSVVEVGVGLVHKF